MSVTTFLSNETLWQALPARIKGVFRSVKELDAAIREYIEVHNEKPKPFVWTKTADQILASTVRSHNVHAQLHPKDLHHESLGQETRWQ